MLEIGRSCGRLSLWGAGKVLRHVRRVERRTLVCLEVPKTGGSGNVSLTWYAAVVVLDLTIIGRYL